MSTRKKPSNLVLIEDLAGADKALAEIAEHERDLAYIEAAMNKAIDKAKTEAEKLAAPIRARLAALDNGLHAFGAHHKVEVVQGKRRSVELTFGTLGFRQSTEVKPMPKTTWTRVLELLKQKGYDQAVRVKEEPDKDVLHTYTDEELAEVSVRRVAKDSFWYEVKAEAVNGDAA